jgi:hypothetical protein
MLDTTLEQVSCACLACDSLSNCTYIACTCGNNFFRNDHLLHKHPICFVCYLGTRTNNGLDNGLLPQKVKWILYQLYPNKTIFIHYKLSIPSYYLMNTLCSLYNVLSSIDWTIPSSGPIIFKFTSMVHPCKYVPSSKSFIAQWHYLIRGHKLA